MEKKLAIVALVCACALVGCGDELGDLPPDAFEPDVDVASEPEPDAGAPVVEPAADSGALAPASDVADAQVEPMPVVDVGGAVEPVKPVKPSKPAQPVELCAMHRDDDGDGYGAAEVVMLPCNQWGDMVPSGGDCFDGNAAAHPGAVGWFSADRGDGSFDYDCDGVELQQETRLATCPVFTAEARDCYPPNAGYQVGDPRGPVHCYQDLIGAKVDAARNAGGWWLEVPACGNSGQSEIALSWSREDSYQCTGKGATNNTTGALQLCR